MVATLGRRYGPTKRQHVAGFLFLLACALFRLLVCFTEKKGPAIAGGGSQQKQAAPNVDRVNETLRQMAEIDEGEPEMARQAFLLLEALGSPPSFLQGLWGWVLGRPAQENWVERARLRLARGGVRLPAGLARHADRGRWSRFRSSARAWLRGRRHDARVMRSLLRHVGTPISRFQRGGAIESEEMPYESCAVVGNSGILLNRSYGALIDAHALVIRLNNAPTSGFHAHVGSETHVAFLNSHVLHTCTSGGRPDRCFCHGAYGRQVAVVVYVCQLVHFLDVLTCADPSLPPTLVTDPRLDVLAARIAKYYSLARFVSSTGRPPEDWSAARDGPSFHYSSGFQAVLLALGICDRVSLLGFGKLPDSKHHYHTDQADELYLHDYLAEYQFYRDLANNNGSSIIPFLSNSDFVLPPLHIYM